MLQKAEDITHMPRGLWDNSPPDLRILHSRQVASSPRGWQEAASCGQPALCVCVCVHV